MVFDALLDWNFWGNFSISIKERECEVELPERKLILVIKGVRRSGKSSITYNLAKKFETKETLIMNFEDPRLKNIYAGDILKAIEIYQRKLGVNNPKMTVFDEVQNIKKWENIARLLAEARNIKVVVTGSSSKLMSAEYASVLTGRHIDKEMFPLIFREFVNWNDINADGIEMDKNRAEIMNLLEEYLKYGGFPEVVLMKKDKFKLLRTYFDDILTKDIIRRFGIREIKKIEILAKIYLANVSTLQSFNKLKNVISASLDTVERFSNFFETARLFFYVPKFSYATLKEQVLNPKKVYCIDTGLINSIAFRFSENFGRLMENLVAIELFRRRSYWHNDWEIYYWKDYQQHETDFIVKEGPEVRQLIQVTCASGKDEIEKREIDGLIKGSEELNCKNLLVITHDYEDEIKTENKTMRCLPLWKWLINVK